jgi:DNA processing protein
MKPGQEAVLRRLALAARAPALSAVQLAAVALASADLEPLEGGDADALIALGLSPKTARWFAGANRDLVEPDLRWLETPGAAVLGVADADYPELLRQLPDAPPVLYVSGDSRVLGEPQIAMVGSRNPSAGGAATARDFAANFARAGIGVTSGLALGIDAASHEGALAAGGTTIAVLGCGPDRIYPAQHEDLAARIRESGAIVSEFPPGTAPRPALFPQRNRIIAGLSLGTLVVEAARRSGSLITARLAGIAGREVFAVPSSIHNPVARGCHELIRQGAKLVEGYEDVLSDLKISLETQLLASPPGVAKKPPTLDKAQEILLDALAFEPASVDSLIERTGLNSESITSMLLILELEGHVAPHPGGRYSRLAGN